ncbi:hypothetical protein D3C85_1725780 [compost metagenome]
MAYGRDIEADFDTLIDLMADMIDAQVDVRRTDGDDWIVDLQALSVKLFKQLCSARSLLEPRRSLTAASKCSSLLINLR